MTSNDVMWRQMTSGDVKWCHIPSPSFLVWSLSMYYNLWKKSDFQTCDLELWPLTLIIELIRDIVKVHSCTKYWVRRSNGSVVRALTDTHTHTHTHTHRETDGRDRFYYLDRVADAGGNNVGKPLSYGECVGPKVRCLERYLDRLWI